MKNEVIQAFLIKNGECFDSAAIIDVERRLQSLDDSCTPIIMSMNLQKPNLILIIAILLGWERFFLDDIALGLIKVILCYGCGIWWLIDIFTAKRRAYEYNYRKFNEALSIFGK